mgnify:CR=1 FL=1
MIRIATPRTAQFVAINGRYMPRALYSAGDDFFIYISTSWTNIAITRIKDAVLKNSIFNGERKKYQIIHEADDAMVITNITAIPILMDTSILFDTPKNEHKARNRISTMLFINSALSTIIYHVI